MKRRQRLRYGLILVSFFLFPATYYYLSPVLIIKAALDGIVNGSFIIFTLLFISSLLCGRAYCGWLCPAAGCQEAIFPANNTKIVKGNLIKWLIWIPWLCTLTFFAIKAGGLHTIDFFYETTHGLSIGNIQALLVYNAILFLLIVIPAFVFGKRSFCHHLCWMAPFMIVGRKIRNRINWSSLRLKVAPDKCRHCHTCTDNCPMSLPVELMVRRKMMEASECILCGSCVDNCQAGVIEYSWSTLQTHRIP